jgi:SAM-dependent methyltransferase
MENPQLCRKVHDAYSAAALHPEDHHAFPVGRQFAENLGYPPDLLATLPHACVESFSGVSNVSLLAEIPPAATVLDLGCGAGSDSLIAARLTGPGGRVIGIDFSLPMLARAREGLRAAAVHNVLLCQADAGRLPLLDRSVNVVLVNGIFNLNPAREAIFAELGRVVEPGGTVYAAELVLNASLSPEQQSCEANWFA